MSLPDKVRELIEKGVAIRDPSSVDIGDEVHIDRISGRGVVLYGGTKIYGAGTIISEGVKIGYEAPATVVDCLVAPGVELNGGFFQSSVFLDRASIASGAHVREGCLLEEETKAGHTVGLKQTILFPFVTLGSLINFCDCLMAGGAGRENHSEVGSSYVHFNYTPQQDKATPSLIGDVPRGVTLNQPPIFLGGQGGLVGPVRLDYGTVITAGTVWRHDSAGAKLLHGNESRPIRQDYHADFYGDIRRKVYNNIVYIANLLALSQWYVHVRRNFFLKREMGAEFFEGARRLLNAAIGERLRRFHDFSKKMLTSVATGELKRGDGVDFLRQQRELAEKWPEIERSFEDSRDENMGGKNRDIFLEMLEKPLVGGSSYIEAIRGLDGDARLAGTLWLQEIVDDATSRALARLPSFRSHVA